MTSFPLRSLGAFALVALAVGPVAAPSSSSSPPSPTPQAAPVGDAASSFAASPSRLGGGGVLEVPVAGVAGVGGVGEVESVVLNVTAVDAAGPGYVTVWPCGERRPVASNVNVSGGVSTVANSVVVKVGSSGSVCVFADVAMDVVVDVGGWFPVGGGFRGVGPSRVVDTRQPGAPSSNPSSPAPGGGTSPSPAPGAGASPSPAPSGRDVAFAETFAGNRGLERFRTGVFHRDVDAHGRPMPRRGEATWRADHAHEGAHSHGPDCGPPDTPRIIDKVDRSDAIYVCREHLMTSMGDVDSYSVVWFAPDQTFTGVREVCWSVNVTDLGSRQWWEVVVAPVGAPDLSAYPWLEAANLPPHPADGVVGIFTDRGALEINTERDWKTLGEWRDPDDPARRSVQTRRRHCLTDDRNGTITFSQERADGSFYRFSAPGAFPRGESKVVFKDHNYTPDKDGRPMSYTWHWDDIVVRTG